MPRSDIEIAQAATMQRIAQIAPVILARHWAEGGKGAAKVARKVIELCEIMTMPGLPKTPSAEAIDLDDNGKVVGLF